MSKEIQINVNKLKPYNQIDPKFDCGDSCLNNTIRESYYAHLCRQLYIYEIESEDLQAKTSTLLGYYAFSITRYEKNDFDLIENDSEYSLPGAIYLEYIAIDKEYQKKGIGTKIIKRFIMSIREKGKEIPIGLITLKPINNKNGWYEKIGFTPLGEKTDKKDLYYMDIKNQDECDLIEEYMKRRGN